EVLTRRMRKDEDLFESLPVVEKDVRVADAALTADFSSERIGIVFPIHHDPHIDVVLAHQRQQQGVDFVDDQVALDDVSALFVRDAQILATQTRNVHVRPFRYKLRRSRGSSASRTPSPMKLKAITNVRMARPGNAETHHWSKFSVPWATMAPHSGAGGGEPSP